MWDVYVTGEVNFLYSVLQGIAGIFNGNLLTTAVKVFLLLSVLQLGFSSLIAARAIPFQQVLVTWIIFSVLFVPKTTVALHARDSLHTRVVANVPLGIASFASMTSSLGYSLANIMEQAFSQVNSQEHVTQSFEKILELRSRVLELHSSKDSPYTKSWENYFSDCVAVSLQLPASSQGATNLSFLTTQSLPQALEFNSQVYYTQIFHQRGWQTLTCSQAYSLLVKSLTANAGPHLTSQEQGLLNQDLASLAQGQLDAQKYMELTTLSSLMLENSQYLNLGKTVAGQSLAQLYSNWSLQGNLFSNTVKPILTFLEGFFFAMAPIVVLLMLLGNYGISLLGKYAMLLVWLQMWQPIISVINLYYQQAITKSLRSLQGVSLDSFAGITLFSQKLESYIATSGILLAGVGSLALFVIYGGAVATTSLVGKLTPASGEQATNLSPSTISSAPVIQGGSRYSVDSYLGSRQTGSEASIGEVNLGRSISLAQSSIQSQIRSHSQTLASMLSQGSNSSVLSNLTQENVRSIAEQTAKTTGVSQAAVTSFLQSSGSTSSTQDDLTQGTTRTVSHQSGANIKNAPRALGSASDLSIGNSSGGLLGALGAVSNVFGFGVKTEQQQGANSSASNRNMQSEVSSQGQSKQNTESMTTNILKSFMQADKATRSKMFGSYKAQQMSKTISDLQSSISNEQSLASYSQQAGLNQRMPILALAQHSLASPQAQAYLDQAIAQDSRLSAATVQNMQLYQAHIPDHRLREQAAKVAALFQSSNTINQQQDFMQKLVGGK